MDEERRDEIVELFDSLDPSAQLDALEAARTIKDSGCL